jgi:hypothetical protein
MQMTRLAEVKAERDAIRRELDDTQMCAMLALRDSADHVEHIDDATIPTARYVISAYGLTRANGGYVVIRFVCPGQNDSFRFHAFDSWRADIADAIDLEFKIAAERIGMARNRLAGV